MQCQTVVSLTEDWGLTFARCLSTQCLAHAGATMQVDDEALALALDEVIKLGVLVLVRVDEAANEILLRGWQHKALECLVVPNEGFHVLNVELDCKEGAWSAHSGEQSEANSTHATVCRSG